MEGRKSSVISEGEESTYEDNLMSSFFSIYGDNEESDAGSSFSGNKRQANYEDTSIEVTRTENISNLDVKPPSNNGKSQNENGVAYSDESEDETNFGTYGKMLTGSMLTSSMMRRDTPSGSYNQYDDIDEDLPFQESQLKNKKPLIFTKIVESKFEDAGGSMRSINSVGNSDDYEDFSPIQSDSRTIKFEDESYIEKASRKRVSSKMNPLKSILRYRTSFTTRNSDSASSVQRSSSGRSDRDSLAYTGDLMRSERFTKSAIANYDKLIGGVDELVAAAAVVASSSLASSRPAVHFSVGEKCLVILAILNGTLTKLPEGEEHSNITKNPVNKFGFPRGLGFAIEEQRGPYNYVLCNVKAVHFDEDARYYTITRIDMGIDQRAEPGKLLYVSKEVKETNNFNSCRMDGTNPNRRRKSSSPQSHNT